MTRLPAKVILGYLVSLALQGFLPGSGVVAGQPPAATSAIHVSVWLKSSPLVRADVSTPSGLIARAAVLQYTLYDEDSLPAGIVVDYSLDAGATWTSATMGSGGDGVSNLACSPAGESHAYWWDLQADVVVSTPTLARLRVLPSNAYGYGAPASTGDFTVIELEEAIVAYLLGAGHPQEIGFLDMNQDGRVDAADVILAINDETSSSLKTGGTPLTGTVKAP